MKIVNANNTMPNLKSESGLNKIGHSGKNLRKTYSSDTDMGGRNENILNLDKGRNGALESPCIVVIETNSPSSQALKNFGLKVIQIKACLNGEVK